MIRYLPFSIIYFLLCNWIQIYYLLGNLLKTKTGIISVDGKGLLPLLKRKTGLNLTIKIMPEKKRMIGFMVSTPPFKPVMIFSDKLYRLLTKDEFEWVALHESGHYLMWHNLKFVLVQFMLYLLGILLLSFLNHLFLISNFVFGVILSFFYVQIVRVFEFQADFFAATHMDNPKGMITSNLKMKKINKALMGGKGCLQKFIIAVSPEDRIKMAERQIVLKACLKTPAL